MASGVFGMDFGVNGSHWDGNGYGMAWHGIIPSHILEMSHKSFCMCRSVFCMVDMVSYL
jgi:hypothetical protein